MCVWGGGVGAPHQCSLGAALCCLLFCADAARCYLLLPSLFQRPVIIHRAILGSVERFMAILCEHTAGHWPLWLSPRQVLVCPIGSDHAEYAEEIAATLKEEGYFVDLDASAETLGKRLRQAQELRHNYVVVVGTAEVESGTISVRPRGDSKPLAAMTPAALVAKLKQEVLDKAA